MYDLQIRSLQVFQSLSISPQPHSGLPSQASAALRFARGLHRHVCLKARLRRFWAWLTGNPRELLDLREIEAATTFRGSHDVGLQTVRLCQIRGSENRAADFDAEFCPRQERTRERWVGLAMARQMGTPLPAVTLIKVGDVFFVRDGHHRISVARAFGQEFIEAVVTVWQLAPLPATVQRPMSVLVPA